MKKVLFTCVGSSDPVRGDFDGPMLHIIRHYRPEIVYFYMSKEMSKRKDHIFLAIKTVNKNIGHDAESILLGGEKVDVSDFDTFNTEFERYFKDIKEKHPDAEILVNISSGTPQMLMTLALLSQDISYNIRVIQVLSPAKSSNKSKPTTAEDYDVKEALDNNYDELDEAENRCAEPKLIELKRSLAKEQLKALLYDYNYDGCEKFARAQGFTKESRVMKLIKHLSERQNLKNSVEIQKEEIDYEFYPIKDSECKRVTEYMLILIQLQKLGKVTELLIRLNPLVIKLQIGFLDNVFNVKMDEITSKAKDRVKFDTKKIGKNHKELAEILDKKYRDGFKDSDISIKVMKDVINFFANKKKYSENLKKLNHIDYLEMFNKFDDVNEYRNKVAHSLIAITEEKLKEKTSIGTGDIVKNIKKIITFVHKNTYKEEILNVYDEVNEMILENIYSPNTRQSSFRSNRIGEIENE